MGRLYPIEVDVHTGNLQEVKLLPVADLSLVSIVSPRVMGLVTWSDRKMPLSNFT